MRSLLFLAAGLLDVAGLCVADGRSVKTTKVTYFVKQPKAKELLERAAAIADPDSESYGVHMSFEEVVEMQRPNKEDLDAVLAHLAKVGACNEEVSPAGDKIVAEVPEGALRTAPHLETALDGFLAAGSFDMSFMKPLKRAAGRGAALPKDDPQACLTPPSLSVECYRKAYGIGGDTASSSKNSQAVIVNENFKPSDLAAFLSQNHLQSQQVVKEVGGSDSGDPGDEGSLDVQYIIGMGSGTPTWWVYIDGSVENPFASWLTYMSSNKDIPLVQSLSVGTPEGEVGEQLVARMNSEMAAIGARGVSILFASGDSGYEPEQKFGAGSPFVTAVGGVWRGEMGYDDFLSTDQISTGGFSSLNANPIQTWQKKAVASYLKTKGMRPDRFNSSRRCVPDVAAFDDGVTVMQNGEQVSVSGTSVAAPVVAGMMSLINDALLQAGHSPLGFLNPFLYANEDAFFDIVKGDNRGFAAVPGYDPASGLGTFSVDTFQKLKTAAVAAKEAAAARRANRHIVV